MDQQTQAIARIDGLNGSYADVRLAFSLDGFREYEDGVDLDQSLTFLAPTRQIELLPVSDVISYDQRSANILIIKV